MSIILPVGDCHISEDDDLKRFKYLAGLIVDEQPEYIVFIGDFLTLNVFSDWDKNKRLKMEGRRYKKEIDKGNEALDIIFYQMNEFNDRKRKNKEKLYRPEVIYLLGNHENRSVRYLESDPSFEGFISIEKDLKLKERGINVIPYREFIYINGIAFTHIPFNKSREICGINITRKASQIMECSCVFGHVHSMEYENFKRHGQKDIQQILTVGCFFEKEEEYIHGRITEYWKGLVLLDSFKNGNFDFQTFSMEKLKERYN